jgi:hypothetical protein
MPGKISNYPSDDAWRQRAHEIITKIAKSNSIVVSDMVVTELEKAGLGLNNYSKLGGVFTRAAKEGLIQKTDTTQQSTRKKSKSAKTIWRSLVYVDEGASAEQNTLSALLIAALDFNAETIRLASTVYAGGQLTQESYMAAIQQFNAISDKYQSRQAKVMGEVTK